MRGVLSFLEATRSRNRATALLEAQKWPELWTLFAERATHLSEPRWQTLWKRFLEATPQLGSPDQLRAIGEANPDQPEVTLRLAARICALVEQAGFTDEFQERAVSTIAVELQDLVLDQTTLSGEALEEVRWSRADLLGLAGPQFVERGLAEYRALVAARPDSAPLHSRFGLFCKRRGLFEDGLRANQRAYELGHRTEAVLWNLGICATGVGDHWAALKMWRELGISAELGRDGRVVMQPRGMVQVRLTTGALRGAPTAAEDPQFEHVWIERISPCHGEVLSPTFYDVSADAGDLVLHDGAAIGYRNTGGRKVPRFPQLALLERSGHHRFRFLGWQHRSGELAAITKRLPDGCEVYPHTEQMHMICRQCVRGVSAHAHEYVDRTTHRRVHGKLVIPPGVALNEVVSALDAALKASPHLRLACPDLHSASGNTKRAKKEQRLREDLETSSDEL